MKTSYEIIPPFALYQYKLWVLPKIDLLLCYQKKPFLVYEKKSLTVNVICIHTAIWHFFSKICFGTSDSIADLFWKKPLSTLVFWGNQKRSFFASEMGICRSCVFSGRLNFKISNNVLKIIYGGAITNHHFFMRSLILVCKGGFFQKVRWNFFRSPNLKKKYSKKLSWAWNLNFPPITLYSYCQEI